MTSRLKQLQKEVIDFFFPRECLGCGKIGDFICIYCSKKLKRIYPPLCLKCGKPETGGTYCPECWGRLNSIDAIRSVFIFEGIVRESVHALKYRNLRAISASMGEFMAAYYTDNGLNADILLPVPLHERRLRQRGYNQTALLAGEISKIISVPVKTEVMVRVRNSKPQTQTLNAEERRSNMENAFECRDQEIDGKSIAVIDDVCTSGATLEACASALKSAGAKYVLGFTLAREI